MAANDYEVIIIGGSYAGLSAAMTLGRSLRKVLVIDAGKPCNRFAEHAHNLTGFDGESPKYIAHKAKEQVLRYDTVKFIEGTAASVSGCNNDFTVKTEDDASYRAKKVLLSTGVVDILPDIPGFQECWGKTAIHCPYCHGYEIAHKKIGVIAHGKSGLEMAKLIRQWSPLVHILTNGYEDFDTEQLQILHEKGTRVITKDVAELVHDEGKLTKVIFIDGTEEALDAIYVRVGVTQKTEIPMELGCELDDHEFVIVDKCNRTNVEGIFAAGDNMNVMRSLAVATAAGTTAGIFINKELIDESF
jgi:thioredoxin reductase